MSTDSIPYSTASPSQNLQARKKNKQKYVNNECRLHLSAGAGADGGDGRGGWLEWVVGVMEVAITSVVLAAVGISD